MTADTPPDELRIGTVRYELRDVSSGRCKPPGIGSYKD
jgi:hypothetical protein